MYTDGSFPLPDSDSDSDSDSNSKPYGYIVLCRTCLHWLRFRFGSLSRSICIVQEFVSKSKSESESGNRNKLSQRQTQVRTWTQIPNLMTTLYYAEHAHIAQIWTQISTSYFCTRQESKSESIPEVLKYSDPLFWPPLFPQDYWTGLILEVAHKKCGGIIWSLKSFFEKIWGVYFWCLS